MSVRLAGSQSTQCSGTVEIYNDRMWRNVFYDGWDLNNAEVVCNELKCGRPVSSRYGPQQFVTVTCSGRESSRTDCEYRSHYHFYRYYRFYQDYSFYQYAGVICSESLQQPNIFLTSPNGGLVSGPDGAEITRGSSFVFTCSINSSYTPGHFVLISSGSNITKPAVDLSANFSFPAAEYEHQGSYSCVYEIMLPSRTFTSPESEPIHVIIIYEYECQKERDRFPWWLLAVSGAPVVLLLLLILLVVCLVLRRR